MFGTVNNPIFAQTPEKVKVIQNSICIYAEASITSEIIKDNCLYGTELSVFSDFENDKFYKVHTLSIVNGATDSDYGYVLKAYVLDTTISSPAKKLQDNASVKNDETAVFSKVGDSYIKVETISLSKGTKIQILDGYDQNKTYCLVCFENEGNLVNYYIETKNIEVYGINYSVIVAIMTLITVGCIISIVLGVKAKKKQKNKKS